MANNLRFDLTGLAKITIWLIVASLIVNYGALVLNLSRAGWDMERYFLSQTPDWIDWTASAVGLAATIAAAIWIYRASWNAREVQPDPHRIGPGWAVGWHFIPVANLWKPWQAMRQCWNSSTNPGGDMNAPAPTFLRLWWLTWIGTLLVSVGFSFWVGFELALQGADATVVPPSSISMLGASTAISAILNVICTLFFIRLIRSITKAQRDASPGLAAVFA
jgi:membrane associated rhomboid family serine protease